MDKDDFPDYEKYVLFLLNKNYDEAKKVILEQITFVKKEIDDERKMIDFSFIAHHLGVILAEQGDSLSALILHELSEALDHDSFQIKIIHAEFLLYELKEKEKAIEKCNEIISLAKAYPFSRTYGDKTISSANYISKAYKLIEKALILL